MGEVRDSTQVNVQSGPPPPAGWRRWLPVAGLAAVAIGTLVVLALIGVRRGGSDVNVNVAQEGGTSGASGTPGAEVAGARVGGVGLPATATPAAAATPAAESAAAPTQPPQLQLQAPTAVPEPTRAVIPTAPALPTREPLVLSTSAPPSSPTRDPGPIVTEAVFQSPPTMRPEATRTAIPIPQVAVSTPQPAATSVGPSFSAPATSTSAPAVPTLALSSSGSSAATARP